MNYSNQDCDNACESLPMAIQDELAELTTGLDKETCDAVWRLVGEIILITESRVDQYWTEQAKRANVLDLLT